MYNTPLEKIEILNSHESTCLQFDDERVLSCKIKLGIMSAVAGNHEATFSFSNLPAKCKFLSFFFIFRLNCKHDINHLGPSAPPMLFFFVLGGYEKKNLKLCAFSGPE